MAAINYAAEYAQALAQAYPNVLHFGALYATENNGRYRMGENGKSVYIPRIKTSGRVDSTRDSLVQAKRNFDNSWELKPLTHQRQWNTLVHPMDIQQTNDVASIQNITQVFNQEQKFPEMDAYTVSTLYKLWSTKDATDDDDVAMEADTTELSAKNILGVFDDLMEKMDEALVPANGRILYVTSTAHKLLKQAEGIVREMSVQQGGSNVSRIINRLDEVEIVSVPTTLMKTAYDFDEGWAVDDENAQQINMFLVHPTAVITPVSYEFAQLDAPSATTNGKYYYFEESFEDVFILNKRKGALQFNVSGE